MRELRSKVDDVDDDVDVRRSTRLAWNAQEVCLMKRVKMVMVLVMVLVVVAKGIIGRNLISNWRYFITCFP